MRICCAKLTHSVFALSEWWRFQIIKIPLASGELFCYIWHWFQWQWFWGERWKPGFKTKGQTKSRTLYNLFPDEKSLCFFKFILSLLMITNIRKDCCLVQWSEVKVQSKYSFCYERHTSTFVISPVLRERLGVCTGTHCSFKNMWSSKKISCQTNREMVTEY